MSTEHLEAAQLAIAELSRIRILLNRIAQTVAEFPTVTGLQSACVKDHDSIPMAIRDAQETFRDTLERNARDLKRIRTLLDREKLANLIYQHIFPHPGSGPKLNSYELADKLRSSLLGSEAQ